ncbi:methionine--tRNA ligase [Sabulicella glaciei]|uniref:Methionine--tRNA ligase n=1 Tax=Sabulicella glaciei TaxID=2984948 RepID=A0ABT3NRZ3_9PROT|nr:methionine--tRNA ligase [Roseococcus sp. MDT2-1-1]MCW8084623.1 methionine--tRNA ligase [Roseococcus sp. MDT2-1-1]
MRRCYLTTPIYYVNDKPHIGHAYTSLAADVLARWRRLSGDEVFFLTGTDEHGQKVEKAARDAGMDPQAFTDRVSTAFRDLTATMGFSNDAFIRTTEERHRRACQELWKRLADRGEIYLGGYEGWYAVRDEAFYGPDELTERDGVKYAPSGAPVEWVTEPSYFFRLSAWQDRLLRFYEENPDFIAPQSRRNEVIAFVKSGLSDLSISRTSFRWGVPVPGDDAHVMYVWLDALTNYITALGWPEEGEAWKFWPADVHFVGKDILRFHAIYWPAFLMAAGLEPPRRVFAHGWWTNEGQKISKSLGNVIDPVSLVEEYGLDPVRYFLLREVPFGQDGDFSRTALANRTNGELADVLGNLANRTLTLIQKNCEAKLPAPAAPEGELGALLGDLPGRVGAHLERQDFHLALEAAFAAARAANAYITTEAPWALRKTDPARMAQVLRRLHDALRVLATVLQPFMPGTMAAMLDQLGVPAEARGLSSLAEPLPEGDALPPPAPLFRKIEA